MKTRDQPIDTGMWMRDLHARALAWVEQTPRPATDRTPAYVDLLFAFGLARIGRAEDAGERLRQAAGVRLASMTPTPGCTTPSSIGSGKVSKASRAMGRSPQRSWNDSGSSTDCLSIPSIGSANI